jgi:hypothetical protein
VGALLIADNAHDSPEYVAHVREPRNGYISLPSGRTSSCRCAAKWPEGRSSGMQPKATR